MNGETPPASDPLLRACDTLLTALLAGDFRTAWSYAAPGSAAAVAVELYGAPALLDLLDEGLPSREYLLLGTREYENLALVEALLWSDETGPRPVSLAWSGGDYPALLNLLRGSPHLVTTISHLEYLEQLTRRPVPELTPVAGESLSVLESALCHALTEIPGGWKSLPGALALWRSLSPGTDPVAARALAAAVCQLTGPWRLTPLVTAAGWREMWRVAEADFAEAWQGLRGQLQVEGAVYRYLPQVPEAELLGEPDAGEGLMGLVQSFLETLEEEAGEDDEEGDPPPTRRAEDGGVIPLFPEDN